MSKSAQFDRQTVVKKATDLYWAKGFHATSMRHLQEVIDMRPGSIYSSFGSKEGLFKEALQYYADTSLAQLEACIQQTDSPTSALKHFFSSVVIESRHTAPSSMCMLVKTISELTEDNIELLTEAKRLLSVIERSLQNILEKAKETKELATTENTERLARNLQMQLMGLRAYARTHDDEALLSQMLEDIFNHKPFLLQNN